ncbi:MAG: DUF2783 domain-containing protein [Burkholderiales bacterium]
MTNLITTPHLSAPDDFYEALIDAHRDLDIAQSHALNARLVLLLANHVGSQSVLKQALDAARGTSQDITPKVAA